MDADDPTVAEAVNGVGEGECDAGPCMRSSWGSALTARGRAMVEGAPMRGVDEVSSSDDSSITYKRISILLAKGACVNETFIKRE